MTKPTGGPAFPRPNSTAPNGENSWAEDGMTLRDWFAGQALIGEMRENGEDLDWLPRADLMAKRCYTIADALIAERER